MELIDTSVWAQKSNPRIREWFGTALVEGDLAICDIVALEILAGTNSSRLFEQTRDDLRGVRSFEMGAHEWRRAGEVYNLLETDAGTNMRRRVKIPDLLIAACAERNDVPILHYDEDYEIIAGITGQAQRWVAPRGELQ